MKRILIISICLFAVAFSGFSDKIIKFNYKKSTDGAFEESADVFYVPFNTSYMFVYDPIIQHVRMEPDQLLYYYPDRHIAIYLNNPDAMIATIPVQLFISTGEDDLGLMGMGFNLIDYHTVNDTLIKTWEIKGKNKDEYVKIDVFYDEAYVFKTISYDADGKMIKSVRYANWLELSNYIFPLSIDIFEEGKLEEYIFSNVKFISELPDSIPSLFNLPDDCEIHEYKF